MPNIEFISVGTDEIKAIRQWASPEIQEYVEHLQAQIAKEMAVPAHLLRPETFVEAQRRAWSSTEIMRRELIRLFEEYSRTVWLIPA